MRLRCFMAASEVMNHRLLDQMGRTAGMTLLPYRYPGGAAIRTNVNAIEELPRKQALAEQPHPDLGDALETPSHRIPDEVPFGWIMNCIKRHITRVQACEEEIFRLARASDAFWKLTQACVDGIRTLQGPVFRVGKVYAA